MKWMIWFGAICIAAVFVSLLVLWLATGAASLGLSGHGLVAIILGFVLTTSVAAALMALTFYSNRSRTDEAVHHSADMPGNP